VCRSWEGAQPGSEPKLANGIIPAIPFSPRSLNIFRSSVKSVSFAFRDRCLGTGCKSVIRQREKKCIARSLFYIFIIGSILSISLVGLLNCLYLNPRLLPFARFSSPFCWGEGEQRVSGCLVLVPGYRVKPWHQWTQKTTTSPMSLLHSSTFDW